MSSTQKPLIIKTKQEMRKWSRQMKQQNKTIGLVPTMGYLHQGHLSLISESQKHTHLTVVSIYINPSQFAANEDLDTYPSDIEGDIEKLKAFGNGVDVVFNPYNLYDYEGEGVEGGHETWVRVEGLEKGMCGTSRPVFFRGVATVVAKLFNVVEPDVAVFGKKDYQQWRVIERMVRDLDFGVEVIGSELVREEDGLAMSSRNVRLSPQDREQVRDLDFGVEVIGSELVREEDGLAMSSRNVRLSPQDREQVRDLDFGVEVIGSELVREEDGLAMSSRNVRLSPQDREQALSISRSLFEAKAAAEKGKLVCSDLRRSVIEKIEAAGGKVDYVEIVDQKCLEAVEEIKNGVVVCVAAWFGKVRLIDNIEIDVW